MKSTATISDAKVKHKADYNGEKLTLNLVLSVDLATPSEPQSINDWFDAEDRGSAYRHNDDELSMRQRLFEKHQANGPKKKGKKAEMPWSWTPPAELLEQELGAEYQEYVETHRTANQRALTGAQEAGLFLLLIGKQITVTIEPAQRSFASLLQLPEPAK